MSDTVTIQRYKPENKSVWDDFVRESKNGTFLFLRDYMDYHADRFPDFSLLGYDEQGELVGILPATLSGSQLSSHAGLTYGGVVYGVRMKTELMLDFFDSMKTLLRSQGIEKLFYKAIPHIYHRLPSEEDLYALFRNQALLVRRDLSSTVVLRDRLSLTKGRRYALKQAQTNDLVVARSYDFISFMQLEASALEEKYGVGPVHSGAEMTQLAATFPDNIKLFTVHQHNQLLAGVLVYENPKVVHAQYIAANETGKRLGALDLIIDSLLESYSSTKHYFDFGISTENGGQVLNSGLVQNKESFGGRAIVHDFYELDLAKGL